MPYQVHAVPHDIRIETLNSGAVGHGGNKPRESPHCGLIWAKIVGLYATTTCRQNVGGYDSKNNGVMATFSYTPKMTSKLESFKIVKTSMRKARNGPSRNLNFGFEKTANRK